MNRNCTQEHSTFCEFERLFRSLAPFVKKPTSAHKTVRIGSKNETDEALARQLADWIYGTEVTLSHSETHDQLHCRGIIDSVDYRENRIEVSVTSVSGPQIWEDTDVWMSPVSIPPNCSMLPTVSQVEQPAIPIKPPEEMDQHELFASINGWKYLGGKFQRQRRKENNQWKNVYLTEMRMTPVEPEKSTWTKFVKEHTALRLSHDIDEIGDVFVEVCRKTDKENSITLAVTGFCSTDVDVPLLRHVTYYLKVDDGEDDELASQTTEDSPLNGYALEQNVEELCEKIGELTVTDVCIKTWFDIRHNVVFIRLVVKPVARTLLHFKKLNGLHVTIHPTTGNSQAGVMALVNKVMRHEIVLTLKGFPKRGPQILFTKEDRFTIRYDHQFEERLLRYRDSPVESTRRQLAASDADIRIQNNYRRFEGPKSKTFASFSSKNRALSALPIGTMVLLGKCWEMEGTVERKAEFVFAVRVEDVKSPTNITFEIKFSKTLVTGSPEFLLTQAFYYIDFDYSDIIDNDECYALYDAYCRNGSRYDSARKSVPISGNLHFYVFEYHVKRVAPAPAPASSSAPVAAVKQKPPTAGSWEKPVVDIDSKKHRPVCFVSVTNKLDSVNRDPLIQLRVGLDEHGNKKSIRPLNIGSTLLLTEGPNEKAVRIRAEVQDTKGDVAVALVQHKTSDLDFLTDAVNRKTLLYCYCER